MGDHYDDGSGQYDQDGQGQYDYDNGQYGDDQGGYGGDPEQIKSQIEQHIQHYEQTPNDTSGKYSSRHTGRLSEMLFRMTDLGRLTSCRGRPAEQSPPHSSRFEASGQPASTDQPGRS